MQQALTKQLSSRVIDVILAEALAGGGGFAEIFAEQSATQSISLQSGALSSASFVSSLGVGIRVIIGSEVGYAYADALDLDVLKKAARHAGAIARGRAAPGPILPRAKSATPDRYPLLQAPLHIAASDKGALLLRADAAARKHDARVNEVLGAFVDQTRDILVVASDGTFAEDSQTMCRLNVTAMVKDGNERRSGYAGGGGRVGFEHFAELTPEKVGAEAARMAVAQLGAREAPAGAQTVVLSPGWSGILLHEAVGHGLEADFIHKGTSLFAGKLGEQVASPLCTIIDSAKPANKRGSINVDDEGCVPQDNVLIENGILKGYLADKISADITGYKRTGSGRRQSYRHAPMPRMTNTYMAAGKSDPQEILAGVKNGLYCAAFGGGQVDISNGNFVFEVQEGYMIENGRLTYPVKNATLIGVGPKALRNISMVGNDAQFDPGIGTCGKDGQSVPVGVGMPTVRIDDLTVGGTRA